MPDTYGHNYYGYQPTPVSGYGSPQQPEYGHPPAPGYQGESFPPPRSPQYRADRQGQPSKIRELLGRRGAKAIAGGIATVLITILGIAGTYVLAPSQEVASQQAVDEHQRDQDARTVPVIVEDVYGTSSPQGEPNLISDSVVDLDGRLLEPTDGDLYGGSTLLPSPFPTSNVLFDGDNHFISGSKQTIGFTLTGQQNATVRIRNIQAVVTERNPAFKGTMIFFPPQGNIPNLQMGFDLDSEDLSARVLNTDDSITDDHYFRENTVSLMRGEPIGFNTIATTTDCACKYLLVVEFSDGRTIEINDNGQDFMLAPYRNDASRIYTPSRRTSDGENWVLTRCPSMLDCSKIAYK